MSISILNIFIFIVVLILIGLSPLGKLIQALFRGIAAILIIFIIFMFVGVSPFAIFDFINQFVLIITGVLSN